MHWYLEVKVADVLAMHKAKSLQDLLHELNGLTLQQVLLCSNEVKQLPSTNTEMSNTHVLSVSIISSSRGSLDRNTDVTLEQ